MKSNRRRSRITPSELIGKEWLLVAANKDGKSNAMTASWGAVGEMWGKVGRDDRDSPTALHEDLSGSDRDVFPWYFPRKHSGRC